MARKHKPVRLAHDGEYKTDGMYRSGGPEPKCSPTELQQQYRDLFGEFNQSALDRVREIRAWLTTAIAPHIDGPHDPHGVLRSDELGWFENLTLSTATGTYSINAERRTWVENCVDALRENSQLEQLLIGGDDLNSIVRLSVRQGQFMQRILDRAIFSPFVQIGKRKSYKSRNQADATNKKREEQRPDYAAMVSERMVERNIKYTPACREIADECGVTFETVRNNSPELRPGRSRK